MNAPRAPRTSLRHFSAAPAVVSINRLGRRPKVRRG